MDVFLLLAPHARCFEVHTTPCYLFIVASNIPLLISILSSEDHLIFYLPYFLVSGELTRGRVFVISLIRRYRTTGQSTSGDRVFL